MILKQTNEAMKCPTCKKYGLQKITIIGSSQPEQIREIEGHIKYPLCSWIYRCRNCYAEFMEAKDGN